MRWNPGSVKHRSPVVIRLPPTASLDRIPGIDVPLSLEPMEAESVSGLPEGSRWQYEPKWDGFRCVTFKDGDRVELQSRNQKPLGRYFPELVEALVDLPLDRFVFDGEILAFIEGEPTFEVLQLRLHPAASRVAKLAEQQPATFMAFDLLAGEDGKSVISRTLRERRALLESMFEGIDPDLARVMLSPATTDRDLALRWLREIGHGLDGIVAKRLDLPYQPGDRAMRKYKLWTTVDCVIAGVYYKQPGQQLDSLLLGLYDREGLLHYVGRVRVGKADPETERRIRPLIGGRLAFSGRAPGGPSRWSGRERNPIPVKPKQVVEVSADHITDNHMRHGARLLRWRDDKPPKRCTMDQIAGGRSGAQEVS
ncbi:ATP-dependent DNA ligase [Mycobacterium sp. KBS0706]|nr:ATP-dependent DNA ligase [Mycobacterium sp. KBS0706]TSD87535.1 ATP-dependent DNA ligase [Mycobacterium sp. KBS0706]